MDHKISMLKRTMGLCEQAKLDVSFYISQLEAMKSAYAKFQGPMDICPNLAADLSFQMCERRAAPEDAHQDWKTMDAMFKDHFRAQQAYRP